MRVRICLSICVGVKIETQSKTHCVREERYWAQWRWSRDAEEREYVWIDWKGKRGHTRRREEDSGSLWESNSGLVLLLSLSSFCLAPCGYVSFAIFFLNEIYLVNVELVYRPHFLPHQILNRVRLIDFFSFSS